MMATFTFYRPDGLIMGYAFVPEEDINLNTRDGQNYIEGEYNHLEYEVINGVPTKRATPLDWFAYMDMTKA